MRRIYLSPPHMGGNERKYVEEAFDLNWVAPVGPHLERFEKSLADYSGVAHVAALCSGTAAIHLALMLLGVQRDDEVLCSTFTFSGSCNPITYVGAHPIFVESEPETWNMSPEFLEQAIKDRLAKGKKPKAVIIVDLYGVPAKMDALLEITRKYEIPVIEDAAEALGSSYKGKPCGSFGDMAIYSFNGNKIITTSGGGALVSQDPDYIRNAKHLATQARENYPHYEHEKVGYNYRLSNISAAIGLGQMEVLEERVQRRREIYALYKKELGSLNVAFQDLAEEFYSNCWLTTIRFLDKNVAQEPLREQLRKHLESYNIESRPLWKPMHMQPVFKDAAYYGDNLSEKLFADGLCLPSGSYLSDDEIRNISKIIYKFIS